MQNVTAMIEVSIPSVHREVDESGKSRKIFRVEILFNGRKHFVLRRYSDFQMLHRKLKKILQPPEFPSKRTQLRSKPLKQRRQELEDYIQVILYKNEVVPQELLDFLEVKHFHTANTQICIFREEQQRDLQELRKSCELLHQRVVGYSCDPYVVASESDLPDMVVAGVLQGFFPRDNKVCCRTSSKSSIGHVRRLPSIPTIVIDRCSLSSLPEAQTT
ncbi:sorting nexin-22 [Tachysurus vachellii]|uniref:sorting nexin-22 n=1 Tax=Tachysurus vachellii TaxID=175792 RepID=UPI00296AA032|nr:sorting nexin-22 [Tachysurus vachellii]